MLLQEQSKVFPVADDLLVPLLTLYFPLHLDVLGEECLAFDEGRDQLIVRMIDDLAQCLLPAKL